MRALRVVWAEIVGLFLDDGRFAGAILAWLMLCWIGLPQLGLPRGAPAVLVFAGLAAILVESALRRAHRGK